MKSSTFDNSIETPKEQIDNRFKTFLEDELLVAIPAKVLNVDNYETQQVVDVQPVFNDVLIDERVLSAPVIKSVFVKIPSGGGFSIKLPIAIGDLVTLHYSQKDLSDWLDSNGSSNISQSTSRIAQKRDCWVTHGFGTRKENQSPSATDYVTEGPNTTITITPDGKVTLDTQSDITVNTPGVANVTATGGCNITADTNITGDLGVTGTVTAPNGVYSTSLKVGDGVGEKELKDHTHNYTDDNGTTILPKTTDGNN
jgi:hypothetical protein